MKSIEIYQELISQLTSVSDATPMHRTVVGIMDEAEKALNEPAKIVIFGTFSAGKSSILNTLLDVDYLKISDMPTTAIITKIVYGDVPQLEALFKDNTKETYPLEKMEELSSEVTKGENLRNHLSSVQLALPHELLKKVTLIDTPGFDSNNDSHTEATKSVFAEADMAYWVFDVDQTASAREINRISEVAKHVKPIGLINKIDSLDSVEELDEIVQYAAAQLNPLIDEFIGISADEAKQAKNENSEYLFEKSNWEKFVQSIEQQTTAEKVLSRKSDRIVSSVKITFEVIKDTISKSLVLYEETLSKVIDGDAYKATLKKEIAHLKAQVEEWNELTGNIPFWEYNRVEFPLTTVVNSKLKDRWEEQVYYFDELISKDQLLKLENLNVDEEVAHLNSRQANLQGKWKEYETSGIFGNEPILFTGKKGILEQEEQQLDEDIHKYNALRRNIVGRVRMQEELKDKAVHELQRYACEVRDILQEEVKQKIAKYNDKVYLNNAKEILLNSAWIPKIATSMREEVLPLLEKICQEQEQLGGKANLTLKECIEITEAIASNPLTSKKHEEDIRAVERKIKTKNIKTTKIKQNPFSRMGRKKVRPNFNLRWVKPVLAATIAVVVLYAIISNVHLIKELTGLFSSPEKIAAVEHNEQGAYEVYVQTDGANIRNLPSLSSDVITAVSKGKRLIVLEVRLDEEGREWLYVELNPNSHGWVSSKIVSN